MTPLKLCVVLTASFVLLGTDAVGAPMYNFVILGGSFYKATAVSGDIQAGYAINHAAIWSGSTESIIDLHPTGFDNSYVYGVSDNTEVGYGNFGPDLAGRALLWHGTAASAVNLNPDGYSYSSAYGVSGNTQVGEGIASGGDLHALVWHGSASSVIDINPPGYLYSSAEGISGSTYVGGGQRDANSENHALLWKADGDVVDLHSDQYYESWAHHCTDNTQVGEVGITTGDHTSIQHAMLWHGTSESGVDLNPAGFTQSRAFDVSGNSVVGVGSTSNTSHALLWTGDGANVIDLHQFQPFQYSIAYGISDDGTIVGEAGSNYYHAAVMWVPVAVPEPTAGSIFLVTAICIASSVRFRSARLLRSPNI